MKPHALALGCLALLVAAPLFGQTRSEAARTVTFSETIAPIVYEHCASCHRPGAIGPFPLISYDDVAVRGQRVADVTGSRHMPPWHATAGHGELVGERRLTETEITAIATWVAQGMPAGDPARMPAVPSFPEGWQLGEPDLVLEMAEHFELPSTGHDVYRNFVLPTGLTQNRWLRAIELRSNAPAAAHHALFAYTDPETFGARNGADGQPGFGGSMAVGFVPGQGRSGSLGGSAVGRTTMEFPAGIAVALPAGTDFLLQMHFHLTGTPEREHAQVGLYFADGPPNKDLAGLQLPALFGFGAGIDIPAGDPRYVVEDSFTLSTDVKVHSAWAHAHHLGREMTVTAMLPDGTAESLLWIQDWDFTWQEWYTYAQPVALPRGTRIDVTILYDNSAANPHNPHAPPERVRWGLESTDEMGTVGLLLELIGSEAEIQALRQSLANRTQAAIQQGVADGTVQRYLAQQAAVAGGGGR